MMLEVVLLEVLVPRRKPLVMKEEVSQVVECVAEHTTTVRSGCRVPVVEEHGVCKLPERRRKRCEQRRRHD